MPTRLGALTLSSLVVFAAAICSSEALQQGSAIRPLYRHRRGDVPVATLAQWSTTTSSSIGHDAIRRDGYTALHSTLPTPDKVPADDDDDETSSDLSDKKTHTCIIGKLKSVTSALVPAIPLQERPLFFEDHFNPRFILQELLLGARYQCELLPLHMFGSIVGDAVQAIFALLTTGSAVVPWVVPVKAKDRTLLGACYHLVIITRSVVQGPIEAAANLVAPIIGTPTSVLMDKFFGPVFAAPISEEIAYRGIVPSIGSVECLFAISVFAFIARNIGILPAIVLEVITISSLFIQAVNGIVNQSPVIGGVMFCHLLPVIQAAILIPATIAIVDFLKRKNSSSDWKDEDVPGKKEVHVLDEWNDGGFKTFIAKTLDVTRRSKDGRHWLYYNYQRVIDRTATTWALWMGATSFATAHGEGGSMCPSRILGVLTSSLLIQSRLLVNRRNIFAPIGAHMFYNLIIFLMPMMTTLRTASLYGNPKLWPLVIAFYPFFCAATRMTANGLLLVESTVSDSRIVERARVDVMKRKYFVQKMSEIVKAGFIFACLGVFSAYITSMIFLNRIPRF